ncbi:hypothetical protein LQZ21_01510 [Treponema sp. TIM-1]|uniref:hypothetical protein n=1 Tax=Treponema sp. TIM-1 TaxID=2898417 RepID=UPI0039805C93
MEKSQFPDDGCCYEGSKSRLVERKKRTASAMGNPAVKKAEPAPAVRETPEKMIRELQGIFCKGRYRSWMFTAGRRGTDW